ncbi:hypothetical protein [Streptomyces sp. 8N706]|uniref:hypothetical protein n=1 Tax=Streptomyces sp. 8N706 TaxID=3457416 RepID=UPI003FD324BE
MDVLQERCAGLDISKKDAKACVRTPSAKRRGSFTTGTTTGSTTNAVLALRDHLLAARVTLVVIEATSESLNTGPGKGRSAVIPVVTIPRWPFPPLATCE